MTQSEYARYLQTGRAEDWREPDPSHSHKCPDCGEKRFCNRPGCTEPYASRCDWCQEEYAEGAGGAEDELDLNEFAEGLAAVGLPAVFIGFDEETEE